MQELTLLLERDLTRRLEQINGVGSIDIWGGINRIVKVELRRDRLNASRLSAQDVRNALNSGNINSPGGNVAIGVREIYVRTLGEFTNLDQIRQTVISEHDGKPIRVGEVADVSLGYEDLWRVVKIDGQPMLRFGVRKQSGSNTVAVAAAIKAELEKINAERSDVNLFVVSDESTFILRSINSVRNSAFWGALLAIVVLYTFLRRGSSTFIIAVSIPISIIATFGLLYFNGLTLNQMSFGGLALGVGLVVDNAVVVLENITRLREEGKDPVTAARLGAKEVGGAIIASTLTTTVIFLPVVFMQTITGVLFQQLALVVVFALFCSLAVALTLVPMLASRLLKRQTKTTKHHSRFHHFFDRVENRYSRVLQTSVRRRGRVMLSCLVLVVTAFAVVPLIPVELTPPSEAEEIDIDLFMASGTNISVLNRALAELEVKVRDLVPEGAVEHYSTDIRDGRAEIEFALAKDSPIGTTALADKLRTALDGQIPGADIRVRAQSGLWILRRIFRSGSRNQDISMEIRGSGRTPRKPHSVRD